MQVLDRVETSTVKSPFWVNCDYPNFLCPVFTDLYILVNAFYFAGQPIAVWYSVKYMQGVE